MRYKIEFAEYIKTVKVIEVDADSQEGAEEYVNELNIEDSEVVSVENHEVEILRSESL